MNPKRQVIEQAIIDLEKNREVVRQVYEERNNTPYGPDFYQRAEELDAAMEKAREERVNIAVRLFRDYLDYQGNPVVGNPNEAFYDPNPTPIFSVGDFHRGPGIPRTIPAITGARTKHSSAGRSTLRRIDKFIKQLKDKMKRRKDLQENNLFQLTETKLKQMILEALKNSRLQDFGIPTPDEQVRAAVGNDELYSRIQTLDKNQADIMKQSFNPGYPREIPRESLDEFFAKYEFVPDSTYSQDLDSNYKVYKSKKYRFYRIFIYYIIEEKPIYAPLYDPDDEYSDFESGLSIIGREPKKLRYNFGFAKGFDYLAQEQGDIDLHQVFDFDLQDEQDREDIESIILGRINDKFIVAIKSIK